MREWSTLKKLIWLFAAVVRGGASWAWSVVTGNAPLTLSEAVAHEISRITQSGLCAQSTTPTPSAPVDIVCNNGALRYGALGQNLLDPSAACTVLGYYINKADGAIKDSPYNFMFAGYMPVEEGKTYVAYGRAKSGNDLSDYNRVAWYDSTKTWIAGANYTQNQIAVVTAPENAAYARFSCNPSGGTSVAVTQAIVDSYNWTFCEGNAEVVPFVPFVGGIYVEGTPETLTVSGANLLDQSLVADDNKYIYAQNGITTEPTPTGGVFRYSGYTPVKEGTTYYFGITPFTAGVAGLAWYSTAEETGYVSGIGGTTLRNGGMKATAPAGAKYIRFSWRIDEGYDTDWEHSVYLCECVNNEPVMSAWQPYVAPQTVNDVPMLLSVGDYKDDVELTQGVKTGKIGVKVLDGTEAWSKSTSWPGTYLLARGDAKSSSGGICTHFVLGTQPSANGVFAIGTWYNFRVDTIETLADWKAWLASEYAAGTPVIVLYPLAEETTEQTTAHALHTTDGENVVGVTANVSPVPLEVEYAKQGS